MKANTMCMNLFFRRLFLKHYVVFTDRISFFEYCVDLIPSQDNPRTQYKEKKTHEKAENRRIEKYSSTEDEAEGSKKEHRMIIRMIWSIAIFDSRQEKSRYNRDFKKYRRIYDNSSVSSRYLEHTIAFSRTFRRVGFLKLYRVARRSVINREP